MNGDFSLDEQRGLEDYRRLSDLFQFYLQLVLSTFTFALGIAGGVCAFVLGKDVPNPRLASFGLLLPVALCTGLGYAFIKSRKLSEELHSALDRLKKQLNRELAPHAGNLTASLKWFGILLVSCGFGLLCLWFYVSAGFSHHHTEKHLKAPPAARLSASRNPERWSALSDINGRNLPAHYFQSAESPS